MIAFLQSLFLTMAALAFWVNTRVWYGFHWIYVAY